MPTTLAESGALFDPVTGTTMTVKYAKANVSSATTDGAVVTAVASRKIRVIAAALVAGGTATAATFNTKPSGSGTAVSAAFSLGINGVLALPYNPHGWFETNASEGLSLTTGSGSTVAAHVAYVEVPG